MLDLSIRQSYQAYLAVERSSICPDPPPVLSDDGFFLQGVRLRYSLERPGPVPPEPVELPLSAYLYSFCRPAVIPVTIIPADVGSVIASTLAALGWERLELEVSIEVFGQTTEALPAHSQEFRFLVTVCDGCLVTCPSGIDRDPAAPGCQCDCTREDIPTVDFPCLPGLDDPVDCRITPICEP